ncbi:MAG: thioesterase [Acidimicrobiia bacterium]|nr:thioesterase [Acidimicrobiia bacterium]
MTGPAPLGRWFPYERAVVDGPVRLFCLPYAGGSAAIYRDWQAQLAGVAEVWPVQLPGRGGRLRERCIDAIDELVDRLVEAIGARTDRPFALFGHSMGGIVAFELARRAPDAFGRPAQVLFVSATPAPTMFGTEGSAVDALDDGALVDQLRRLNGTPDEVLRDPELLRLVLPALRADLRLCESYGGPPPGAVLDCRVRVFAGTDDHGTDAAALDGWRATTSADCIVRHVPGGHFFIHGSSGPLLRALADDLGAVAGTH